MLNDQQQHVVPPAAGEYQWYRILKALHAVAEADGRVSPEELEEIIQMIKGKK